MFTKKQFKAIAEIIKDIASPTERWRVAGKFCRLFNKDNVQFRADKFRMACGVDHFE